MNAVIIERNNGFPSVGDLVYHCFSGKVYKILEILSIIKTNSGGAGNSVDAEVEEFGEPSGYSDEEWAKIYECQVIINGKF